MVLWILFNFAVYVVVFRKLQLCLSWSKRKISLFILSKVCDFKACKLNLPRTSFRNQNQSETVQYRNRFWGKKQNGNWVRKKLITTRTSWDVQNTFLPGGRVNWLCSIVYQACMRLLLRGSSLGRGSMIICLCPYSCLALRFIREVNSIHSTVHH